MAMSPSARGRLGQLTRQVTEGGKAMIAPAQAGLWNAYLERAADMAQEAGEAPLSADECARRAKLLRRIDMIRRAEKARAARNRNRARKVAGLRRRLAALETE